MLHRISETKQTRYFLHGTKQKLDIHVCTPETFPPFPSISNVAFSHKHTPTDPTLRNRFRFIPRSATTTEQIFALIFLARAVSSDELHALRFLRPPARRLHEDGFSGSVPPTPGNGKTSKTVRKEP